MKTFAIIFAALVAMSGAIPTHDAEKSDISVPDTQSRNTIADIITSFLEFLSERLKALGLDPFTIEQIDAAYALPVPSLFNIRARVENLAVAGLSDIVINNMSFGLLTQRLTYDVSIPEISIVIGDSGLDVVILSELITAEVAGKVVIRNPGVSGRVRVGVGISGISIRELDINFYIDALEAEFEKLSLLGRNYAEPMNRFVNKGLFPAIVDHQEEISQMIEIIAWAVINQIL